MERNTKTSTHGKPGSRTKHATHESLMKLKLTLLVIFALVIRHAHAATRSAEQPTDSYVHSGARLLAFERLGCPPKERPEMWLRVVNDRAQKLEFRRAAFIDLVLRHGQNHSLQQIQAWGNGIGIGDLTKARIKYLAGYIPLQTLDLSDGTYSLGFKLGPHLNAMLYIQTDSHRSVARECVASINSDKGEPRILRGCGR